MPFINKYSWKCLLGVQAKEISDHGGIYTWKSGKRAQLVASKSFEESDIPFLENHIPFNFNHMTDENITFLKKHFKVSRSKEHSVIISLENWNLSGSEYKKVRQSHSRCKRFNFKIENNYRKIEDVQIMIEEWSRDYTDKYFRDFSGKNVYFYKNNFHKDCCNIFIYHEDLLVAFGSLSPEDNGNSSYILGKALYKRFSGLSEFADIELFLRGIDSGIKSVNMGRSSKNLLKFKMKYPGARYENAYEGRVESKVNY